MMVLSASVRFAGTVVDCPILRIGLSGFSSPDHYWLGQRIEQTVEILGRRAVLVASPVEYCRVKVREYLSIVYAENG